MKDENYDDFTFCGQRLEGGIRTAVAAWCADRAAAKLKYGPIGSWDTSDVTDMDSLFYHQRNFHENISFWDVSNVRTLEDTFSGATSFNGDLSRWDVSNVCIFTNTFHGATSFRQQLGGSWPNIPQQLRAPTTFYTRKRTRSDRIRGMFDKCPGSIEGMAKDAKGTPVW